jgi:hypothetical protein
MKVLVVYSWDDDISQNRYTILRPIARRAGYDFIQCFAVPHPRRIPTATLVAEMITSAVKQHHPDVLLIHTGAAYHRSPEAFTEAIRQIHQRYPALRLGIERRFGAELGSLSFFEQSEEMHNIEQTFFR